MYIILVTRTYKLYFHLNLLYDLHNKMNSITMMCGVNKDTKFTCYKFRIIKIIYFFVQRGSEDKNLLNLKSFIHLPYENIFCNVTSYIEMTWHGLRGYTIFLDYLTMIWKKFVKTTKTISNYSPLTPLTIEKCAVIRKNPKHAISYHSIILLEKKI